MRKILRSVFFLIACLHLLGSCSLYYWANMPKLMPSISFKNASPAGEDIQNIKVNWNGYGLLSKIGPYGICQSGGGQSFYLKNESDFFGLVEVKWQNASGEIIRKSFEFKRDDLPSFDRRHKPDVYSKIILFFTQTNVEYYTSDHPNFREIQRQKQGNWVYKWFEDEYTHKCVNDPEEASRMRAKAKKYSPISTKTGKPIID